MGTPHDRQTRRLQSDRGLSRWKLIAGAVSVTALIALFATSLARSPNPAFTVLAGVVTVLLVSAMAWGVLRSRRGRE
ncbi:hypothetical protein I4I73_08055 [Pseudonocardia sp. KRD-184]|uniref:Uncharacterized protein n=1 Tax=Pseudonocardia oceani TaxID=2792013 RepID=A0ABS6U8N4_9PSEU|nr:hypothetical protein [Pseudonocardia oceani]MBW0089345.1 hypothetical protein [Pseudonocardia oceani]MBW0095946.1 hypothetical protein [Pseudonocardia oceani]MBW0108641.1 hypothetical protein [Pseudonocardia oceani]MBW0122769.1 hypothetical protein [Pseudonocardia oceani]MBW0128611.1 hypothetical protein [Pseudonocardia oceani]